MKIVAASISEKPTYTISVRSLVEHVLRSGDLRHDFLGTVKAIEGIRAHQKIQADRPSQYTAEVPVTYVAERDGFQLHVTGRIDGVLTQANKVIVEEIKSTRQSLLELEKTPNSIHWGQAKCYAYMLAAKHHYQDVIVRLTYMNMDDGRIREVEKHFTTDTLAVFFNDLVTRYASWMSCLVKWGEVRQKSISKLEFPFDKYRVGQRKMAVAVYRNIRENGHLLVQAATGIGKTMGAVFPALKALGDNLTEKIVFLTARTTGRLAAESALQILRDNGLRLNCVTLTAKDKICFSSDRECGPETCDFAKGHFDRINGAVCAGFKNGFLTRKVIEDIAAEHKVCPFELSLELVDWCDCVICDYNYAFAPGVLLQRLFGENGSTYTVLVDEAHNLVDRSREMFSAQLDKKHILDLRRLVKDSLPHVYQSLGRINSWMAAMRRQCLEKDGSIIEKTLPNILIERLRDFLRRAEIWLALNLRTDFRDRLLECYFDISRFIKIADGFSPSYAVIHQALDKAFNIKLYCIDPSDQLHTALKKCQSVVLFSATLTPAGYFQALLGCHDGATALNLPSPFPSSNMAVFVADQITTLYRKRASSCSTVVRTLIELVCAHRGHYLFFFPSYEYMHLIHKNFVQKCPYLDILIQTPQMTEEQRDDFLNRFNKNTAETLVGFAVMGGIFGEGIDLRGDRLTGAVIVGVGLPGMCIERNLIRDYFNQKNRSGFEFAYQYPGINRVLQAAGRVIRSEKDRGVVLLIDHRYREYRYQNLLPSSWKLTRIADGISLRRKIQDFWQLRH